ncbi:hypothetical protein ANTPLA_LOCUS9073 [Anthophora plagiata]
MRKECLDYCINLSIYFPRNNSAELPEPILDPACKNALVIGGSEGFGFTAADHLLCKGARKHMTKKTILAGLKILGKKDGGSGGIIINCASIFGFMGWPENPEPVYCKQEAAIEITKYYSELNDEKETGVRLVALCPANKQFCDIGLPDFPDTIPNRRIKHLPSCIPTEKYHIGIALSYVLAWAEHGSAWLVEPAVSAHKVPRLIYFPEKEGDKVDPKVYEAQNCTVKLEQPCANAPTTCSVKVNCVPKTPKKK